MRKPSNIPTISVLLPNSTGYQHYLPLRARGVRQT